MVEIRKGGNTGRYDYLISQGWSPSQAKRYVELQEEGKSPSQAFNIIKVGEEERRRDIEPYQPRVQVQPRQPTETKKSEKKASIGDMLTSFGRGFVAFTDWAAKTRAGSGFNETFGSMGPPRGRDRDPYMPMMDFPEPDIYGRAGHEGAPRSHNKRKKSKKGKGGGITIHIRR